MHRPHSEHSDWAHGRMELFHWAGLVWGFREVAPPWGGVVLAPMGQCFRGPTGWSTTHDSAEATHGGCAGAVTKEGSRVHGRGSKMRAVG